MSKHNETSPPDLTAAAIEEALKGRYPSFGDVSPCHRSRQGCHHDVWFVGPNLILRGLPASGKQDGESEQSLEKDAAVSSFLRQQLSKPELIPQVLDTIAIKGWVCNIEVRAHGKSLEESLPTEATGDGLVTLLEGLASIPIEEARAVTRHEEPRPNLHELVSEAISAWNDLLTCNYVEDPNRVVEGLLMRQLSDLSELADRDDGYRPVLLHADISTEHVFIDEPDGAINGIIDWSEAVVGDPCIDISGLSLTLGREMASRVSQKTSYSRLAIKRGLLFAMCLVIRDIQGTVCGNDGGPEELLKCEFRRVFEGAGVDGVAFLQNLVETVTVE